MADERRPMPQITVRDPNRPDRPADVLVSGGDDRTPPDPAVSRRRLLVAGVVVLLVALVAGALELRDRRAQAALERRLGSVVELRAELEGAQGGFRQGTREVDLTLQVLLHNDGPRVLHVTAATAAGHDLLRAEMRVAAGGSVPMQLERTVTCASDEPPGTPGGGLRLAVRTEAGGERDVDLDLPVDPDEAARLCGFRPLETLRIAFGALDRPSPDVVDLGLDVEARSLGPMRLVGLGPPPGIAVQVRAGGRPRSLPLDLLALDDLTRGLSVTLRFTVQDCAAALAPTGPDLPDAAERRSLLMQVADEDGDVSDAALGYPEPLLESLIAESC